MAEILRFAHGVTELEPPKVEDQRRSLRVGAPTAPGFGLALNDIVSWLRCLWTDYVVAEHQCALPEYDGFWMAVSSEDGEKEGCDPGRYVCLECGQHFVAADSLGVCAIDDQ